MLPSNEIRRCAKRPSICSGIPSSRSLKNAPATALDLADVLRSWKSMLARFRPPLTPHVCALARPATARLAAKATATTSRRTTLRARRSLRTRNPFGAHRRVVDERREDDRRLLEILLLH